MDDLTVLMTNNSPEGRTTVIIEDNGNVAYAYLRDENGIVSDVWLYNRCETPEKNDWKDPSKLPFANPRGFAKENEHGPIHSVADVNVHWENQTARIYIHGLLWAVLRSDEKPGYCRLALRDGPLAKPLLDA